MFLSSFFSLSFNVFSTTNVHPPCPVYFFLSIYNSCSLTMVLMLMLWISNWMHVYVNTTTPSMYDDDDYIDAGWWRCYWFTGVSTSPGMVNGDDYNDDGNDYDEYIDCCQCTPTYCQQNDIKAEWYFTTKSYFKNRYVLICM